MKPTQLTTLKNRFDALTHNHADEPTAVFWFTRDLQKPLGYARWENFLTAIQRAIESCNTTGYEPGHHFRGVTKLIAHGGGTTAERRGERMSVQ